MSVWRNTWRALKNGALRALFLLPVLVFVGVSAWFNYLFSATQGDEHTRLAWIAAGLAAAAYSALGLEVTRQAWRRGSVAKAVAACLVWLVTVGYDGLAAYGFAKREQAIAVQRIEHDASPRKLAEQTVRTLEQDLAPYRDALDLDDATRTAQAYERLVNEARCRLHGIGDSERDLCTKLIEARRASGRAAAKARLQADLAAARKRLEDLPPPPPSDKRTDLLGSELVAWLPVVLTSVGTILGVFAATLPGEPPVSPQGKPSWWRRKRPALPADTEKPVPSPRSAATSKPIVGETLSGQSAIVNLIVALTKEPSAAPAGVHVDHAGWVRGGQRHLAAAAGMSLSRFNKEAKEAQRNGTIQMVVANNKTAISLATVGQA